MGRVLNGARGSVNSVHERVFVGVLVIEEMEGWVARVFSTTSTSSPYLIYNHPHPR